MQSLDHYEDRKEKLDVAIDIVKDAAVRLKVDGEFRLVPGHCAPTCNVPDWWVGVRNGKVETLWPVSAHGQAY